MIFAVLIASPVFSQVASRYNLFERSATIQLDSTTATYNLPDSFVIHHSERVFLDSTLLKKNIDYIIDYITGKITVYRSFSHHQSLEVTYQILPLQLSQRYFHRNLLIYQPSDSASTKIPPSFISRSPSLETASSLRQSGSIVRGISIGTNQGLKLESGLRMEISGKIGDKIDVVAALTDQNTPIQPEGNTQTLQEIDKVFIQVSSDRFQATLGDYYLAFEGTEFSPYDRKLQGVMGTIEMGNSRGTLSMAVSRGKFVTNQFLGQEGNQGPYQLKGDRGQIDIIVLAGTEKVWIDGKIMTRGENNDYIIEYSNGQITFTRHRLITADSRVTVDFQYSDQTFQRGLFGVDVTSTTINNKLKLGLRMLRESDDKDNPLDFVLNDETRSRLQLAGDNADSAFISGVNYLGPGKGNYVEVDSAGIIFYRYIGPNEGDYNIAFTFVGSGNGSYRPVGYAHYQYVGAGKGSYNPVIYLTPPQRHDLVDLSMVYQPGKNFQAIAEIALSRLDKNLLSSRDDGDNAGLAMTTRFGLNKQPIKILGNNFGKLDFSGKFRRVQNQFHFIDRSDEVEKNRKWNITDTKIRQEEIIEFNGAYFPVEQVRITGGVGENQRGQNFKSQRWEAGSEIAFKKIPSLRYQIESIRSDEKLSDRVGAWLRQYGKSEYHIWKLKSTVDFQAESKKESFQDTLDLGFRYYEVSPSLSLADWKKMSLTFGVSHRQQDKFESGDFSAESKALTQSAGWELKDWRNLSLALNYIHRERSYADASIGTKVTDLADLRANYSPLNRAIATNWHYQLSNTQVAKQERIYIKVEQGQGNYRFDEIANEYIPDSQIGDYILRIRATDDFTPVIELRASSTIRFQPELLWKTSQRQEKSFARWKKWLSTISTETYLQIEEKTQAPDVWAIYRLDLSRFQVDTTTVYGASTLRQDIYWNRNRKDFSLRLRYNKRSNLSNQYLEGGQTLNLEEGEIRIQSQLSTKISSQLDLQKRNEVKESKVPGRFGKNISSNEIALDLSYRPRQSLELALKTKYARALDRGERPLEVNFFALAPRVNYSIRSKGRLRAELELNQVDTNPANAYVPYEMVSGNRSGTNLRWTASFDYTVSRYLRASLNWNGRYEDYLKRPIYTIRAEMRAFF